MASSASKPSAGGDASQSMAKSLPHDAGHELKEIDSNVRTPLPIEDDLMQLARLGEIGAIQKLFDSGKFTAKYKDDEGITALHVRRQPPQTNRRWRDNLR